MLFYRFTQRFCFYVSKIFFPIKIIGLENLPPQGSFILASNHASYLDPVVLGTICPRYISFVAKESLFKNKILGFILTKLQAFPIRRDYADFRALRDALRRLKQGSPLLLFPEGTRMGTAAKKEVQPGIGFLVAKSGVAVIPVYVQGTDKVLPPQAKFLRRHSVKVFFGKARTFSSRDSYLQIAQRIIDAIYSLPEEL